MKIPRHIRCTGIVVRDHHILLILHRQRQGGTSRWIAPGGGLEPGESEEACIQREMREETGLQVQVERLLFDEQLDGHRTDYRRFKTYLCAVTGGELAPGAEPEFSPDEGYDIAGIEWFDLREEAGWPQSLRDDHMMYPFLRRIRMALGYEPNVIQQLSQCQWPILPPRYHLALYQAVIDIWQQLDQVQGILASGTIIRGAPDTHSDLDIHVIHGHAWRQRIQKWFHDVPVEIFVNPPLQIRQYFEEESASRRPRTAHMLATGFILFQEDEVVTELVHEAHGWLERAPEPSTEQLTFLQYGAATKLEDAFDMAERNPATANMLLIEAVLAMLRYGYARAGSNEPRAKELLTSYQQVDKDIAILAQRFFETGDLAARISLARRIARGTIGTTGFFEWRSRRELLDDS